MDVVVAACLGVGLAAACGLRVFLPLFVLAVGTRLGVVTPGESLAWIGSWAAITGLGVACAAEVVAYYVPWVDNALDAVAGPAAVGAGALVGVTQLLGVEAVPTEVAWASGVIGGGGIAGAVKAATTTTRAVSTATTGGTANPIFSTVENISAFMLSVLTIVVPIIAAVVVIVVGTFAAIRARRLLRSARERRARRRGTVTGASAA